MKRLLLVLALLGCLATRSAAQSGLGHLLNGPDKWWEAQKRAQPRLSALDNRDWKTWIDHAVVATVAGTVLGAVTPLSIPRAKQLTVGLYAIRELYNILHDGNRKYFDSVMDVATPYIAYRITLRW